MKLLISTLFFLNILSTQAQTPFNFTAAYETLEITDLKTRYNDGISVTKKLPDNKKFILIEGSIAEGTDLEIDADNIFLMAGEKKIFPSGEKDRTGQVELKKTYDLRTKWSKTFGYVFIVDKSMSKGILNLGDHKVEVSNIRKEWPKAHEPRSISVSKTELIDAYVAKDNIKDNDGNKQEVEFTYKPVSGKFLVLTIQVMSPVSPDGKKERGKNYTFHPSQFVIAFPSRAQAECAAFLRDGYENEFSESMNNGVLYDDPDKETIRLVFPVGNEKGEYTLYHNGKQYAQFNL